jgi:hypothetical protein
MKNLKTFENYQDEGDMMSDEEVKDEVLRIITDMKSKVNNWSVRDSLKHFTSYGFWNGGEMASIDIETATEIAEELYNYVESFSPGNQNIGEVYDDLYKY